MAGLEGDSPLRREAIEKEARDCAFCRIVEGEKPSIPVINDEWAISFISFEGHPLVIPRRHITEEDYEDKDNQEELTHASELAWKLAPVVKRVYRAEGVNVFSNIGKSAGQDVRHIHIHVMPRVRGDGKLKIGKINEPKKEVKENLARQLRARLLPEISSPK